MRVPFGVLYVCGAGDRAVEDQPELVVDMRPARRVAAHIRIEAGEHPVERALAVAGGEDHGVGGEAGAGALLGVFEVQFDLGGGDAARGAYADARSEDGIGPAAVQSAAVELVVDRGDGVGVDALVELPLSRDERVAGRLGQGVEVARVVGCEVLQAELEYSIGANASERASQWSFSAPSGLTRSRSRKTSAPDCPEPMIVMCSAASSRSRCSR